MDERYSYIIEFELRSGETETLYYENESEAEEAFQEYADENDSDMRAKYTAVTLKKVDWEYRADYVIDGTVFE